MADYYPLLARALDALPDRSPALRRAVYDRARSALIAQLRSLDPPVPEADIDLERKALDTAIGRLEAEYEAPPPAAVTMPAEEPAAAAPEAPPPPARTDTARAALARPAAADAAGAGAAADIRRAAGAAAGLGAGRNRIGHRTRRAEAAG